MPNDQAINSAEYEAILAKLSPEDAETMRSHQKALLERSKGGATAAILARNLSHGIGKSFKK